MEESNFLDKLNDSKLGKVLRTTNIKISQSLVDEINRKYGKNYTVDSLKGYFDFGRTDLLPKEVYEELLNGNEYKFSSLDEVRSALSRSIDGNLLAEEENVSILKEVLEATETKELRIYRISDNVLDLKDLPVENLSINFGELSEESFSKLPTNIKKLKITNVAFNSIGELKRFKGLRDLEIRIMEGDPQLDMSELDSLKELTNLNISGQTLSQEDFDRICSLENLQYLEIGGGKSANNKSESHKIRDFSGIFKLQKLERATGAKIDTFLINPVIKNVDDLRKFLSSRVFETDNSDDFEFLFPSASLDDEENLKEVTYIGNEPLPADLLDGVSDKIKLKILSPLVISDEFARKYENGFPGELYVDGEHYCYTTPELYAVRKRMEEILAGVPKDASEFEKVCCIYRAIGESCFYDDSGCIDDKEYIKGREKITRSLKGGLLEGKLVCRGYAVVVKKLLDELGVESKMTGGQALDSKGEECGAHAWNQVRIDGKWYNLDLTWDARAIRAGKELQFLLMDDKSFNESHRAYDTDRDIREFLNNGEFNFEEYHSRTDSGKYIKKCDEAFDKDKIAEFFGTERKEPLPSKEIAESIAHSDSVTMEAMQEDLSLIAAVQQDKEKGVVNDKQMEDQRDD